MNGQPLVKLPEKTLRVKDLEFTEEERVVYDAYLKQGRELIMRYKFVLLRTLNFNIGSKMFPIFFSLSLSLSGL